MKKSTTILAIVGLAAAAAAGPAIAQEGIILGGSLGVAQYKDTCKRACPATSKTTLGGSSPATSSAAIDRQSSAMLISAR